MDGFGGRLLMDDAYMPGPKSLSYIGCCASGDVVYLNTRSFVLSDDNMFYYAGHRGKGLARTA